MFIINPSGVIEEYITSERTQSRGLECLSFNHTSYVCFCCGLVLFPCQTPPLSFSSSPFWEERELKLTFYVCSFYRFTHSHAFNPAPPAPKKKRNRVESTVGIRRSHFCSMSLQETHCKFWAIFRRRNTLTSRYLMNRINIYIT